MSPVVPVPGAASGGSPSEHLGAIVEGNPVATFVIDAEHRVTHWNAACQRLTGLDSAEVCGTREHWRAFYASARPLLADLILDGDIASIERFYDGKCRPSQLLPGAWEVEDFFPTLGSAGCWLFFTAAPIRDAAGAIVGAIETLQDVSDRRRAEAALIESKAFLAQIVDGSSVATFVIDHEHRVTHWNRACEMLTGLAAREVLGTTQQWRAFYGEERPVLADIVLDGGGVRQIEHFYRGKFRPSLLVDGAFEAEDFFPAFGECGRWVYFTAAPLRDAQGSVIGAIETLQDITKRKLAEQALRENEERYRILSLTDSLTGLFNSRHFHEQLEAEIDRAERFQRPLALLIIDADNFKQINDTYGHLAGDCVLKSIAQVIEGCLRRTDSGYRYGGEEFAVLMPETSLEAAAVVAERLRKRTNAAVMAPTAGTQITCTVSVGVAQFHAGDSADALIRRADSATYQAKRRGKNCIVVVEV